MSNIVSVRLTNEIRTQIVRNACKMLIQPRKDALAEREAALADKVMALHIGTKNAALVAQLPAEYFESGNDVRAVDQQGKRYDLRSKLGFRKPANLLYGNPVEIPHTHGIWKDIRAIDVEEKQINKDDDTLRAKILGLLNGCATTKTLLAAWPDAEQYLPAFAAKTNLPAVRCEDESASGSLRGTQSLHQPTQEVSHDHASTR